VTALLKTENLTKQYAGLTAINSVNFTLQAGQIHALIGPNGAGKTTFVGLLSGRIKATSGTVEFKGVDITGLPAHERIDSGMAYTFQITSIFAKLSVYDNVALAARKRIGAKPRQVRERVNSVLTRIGIESYAKQIAGDLSYGHQRLLEIAMGLSQTPELFIMDEPTQGLSDPEIEQYKTLVKDLAGDTTILLIEHNMDVVMSTADQITVLDQGEVLATGSPEEIRNNTSVQAAYLGTSDTSSVSEGAS